MGEFENKKYYIGSNWADWMEIVFKKYLTFWSNRGGESREGAQMDVSWDFYLGNILLHPPEISENGIDR